MAISFTNVAHFFGSSFHDILVGARAVVAHQQQIDATMVKVEEVTAATAIAFPPALEVLEIERISVFALGVACALYRKYGNVDEAAKAHPEIEPSLWVQLERLLLQYPQLIAQSEALFKG